MSTRRRFLRQSSAIAAGGLLLPHWMSCASGTGTTSAANAQEDAAPAAGEAARRPLGIAILGLGGYAKGQIAPALQLTEHCKLVGLITGSPEKLPEWRKQYNIAEQHCYTYDTMHQIAQDEAIDVVYVITPTATHKDFAVRAAQAGKHVWCEKPMAMTVADCHTIIDACDEAGVKLAIGYRMLHEPNTQQFIDWCAAQPDSNITKASAAACYAGSPPPTHDWRGQRAMGGGALYDMGVYAINGLRYSTGLVPEAVVRARQERPQSVDVTTTFTLRFPGGFEAEGLTSVLRPENYLRVEFGQGTWAEMQPLQPYQGVAGKASDGTVFGPPVANQQSLQMDDDALAILQGMPLLAPGREGLIDIAIIRAVIASAESGREVPIELS